MWENRITLDRFVYHESARKKIEEFLKEKNLTDECITDLQISSSDGYMSYKIILSDETSFKVFDDGTILEEYIKLPEVDKDKVTTLREGVPRPPLDRIIKEGVISTCNICHSTRSKKKDS